MTSKKKGPNLPENNLAEQLEWFRKEGTQNPLHFENNFSDVYVCFHVFVLGSINVNAALYNFMPQKI
jgi:hypothetical protein